MTTNSNEVSRLNLDIEAVREILRGFGMDNSSKEDYVQSLMMRLEEFAESEPNKACCLMTALWPVASELFMHDICDGIDLWIVNNQSTALLKHLERLSASELEASLKRHWDDLISNFI